MTYITKFATTENNMPAETTGMTAGEIVIYCRDSFRVDFDEMGRPAPANAVSAYMREVSATYFDPAHWKNAFHAHMPFDAAGRDCREWVAAAVIWFHGAGPAHFDGYNVASQGYAC